MLTIATNALNKSVQYSTSKGLTFSDFVVSYRKDDKVTIIWNEQTSINSDVTRKLYRWCIDIESLEESKIFLLSWNIPTLDGFTYYSTHLVTFDNLNIGFWYVKNDDFKLRSLLIGKAFNCDDHAQDIFYQIESKSLENRLIKFFQVSPQSNYNQNAVSIYHESFHQFEIFNKAYPNKITTKDLESPLSIELNLWDVFFNDKKLLVIHKWLSNYPYEEISNNYLRYAQAVNFFQSLSNKNCSNNNCLSKHLNAVAVYKNDIFIDSHP